MDNTSFNINDPLVQVLMKKFYGSKQNKFSTNTPLCFISLASGSKIRWNNRNFKEVEYSFNKETWIPIENETLILGQGKRVYFRGKAKDLEETQEIHIPEFTLTGLFRVVGNIMSMLTPEKFWEITELEVANFNNFFYGCKSLLSASCLLLPAQKVFRRSYVSMFHDCTNLKDIPRLPATELDLYCYSDMFQDCTNLEKAIELPATILAEGCYHGLFKNCISLEEAPELPATELGTSCYVEMFSGCASLKKAPQLPGTILPEFCYSSMFLNCTSLVEAPELPATVFANSSCYSNMFRGCKNLEEAPDLLSLRPSPYCYMGMFAGCEKLRYIKCLATDLSYTDCVKNWVDGVSETGIFVKNSEATDWTEGESGIPSGWTVEEE